MKLQATLILTFASALLIVSCKKKSNVPPQPTIINTEMAYGLPENNKAINGYLYSCIQTNVSGSNSAVYYIYAYAAFSDPARNLINSYNHYTNTKVFAGNMTAAGGNIDVGNVYVNNQNLNKSGGGSEFYYMYSQNNVNAINYAINWQHEGNKTFKPINTSLNIGYPTITTNSLVVNNSFSKGSDLTINLGNNITNYDSLIVSLNDGNLSRAIVKRLPKNSTSVTFTAQDMMYLYTSSYYGQISFYAINYSNITIDSKVNIFELNNQYIRSNLTITP